jgi:hypothetical protein
MKHTRNSIFETLSDNIDLFVSQLRRNQNRGRVDERRCYNVTYFCDATPVGDDP